MTFGSGSDGILLVTGTSTDVGKTVATAACASIALRAGKSVAVLKPAQTGLAPGQPGDLAEVDRLSGGGATLVELARYPDPLAPDTAARLSGLAPLTLAQVCSAARELNESHDVTLVEGAGGLLVRLGESGFTLRDVAVELAAKVLVVVSAGLGTLNHTALTMEALATAGVPCAGLVIGSWPREPGIAERTNLDELVSVSGVDLLGSIPADIGVSSSGVFADVVDRELGALRAVLD